MNLFNLLFSRGTFSLTQEQINDLARRISAYPFMGISIADTLHEFFNLRLVSGRRISFLETVWAMKEMAHLLQKENYASPVRLPPNRPVWLILLGVEKHLYDEIIPIIEKEGINRCGVIGVTQDTSTLLQHELPFFSMEWFAFDRAQWYQHFEPCHKLWIESVQSWVSQHRLPKRLAPLVMLYIILQTQQVSRSYLFLKHRYPDKIVCLHPTYAKAAPLLLLFDLHGPKGIS
jgi:hypothetical protein